MSEEEVDDREEVPNDVLGSRQLVCPSCGYAPEAVQGIEEGTRPKLEDRVLCWGCGAVNIYDRTALGYWQMRAPTPEEQADTDADEQVADARAQMKRAKARGRGAGSIGYDAGGAPRPDPVLVVLPAEPVSWAAAVERHDLSLQQLAFVQEWSRVNVLQHGPGPGVVEIACGACDLPVRVGPEGSQMIFQGARLLCVVCVQLLQARARDLRGES